jgi:Mg2+/citrate symporter
MQKRKVLKAVGVIAGSFFALVGTIVLLLLAGKVSFATGMLMIVALVAMYLGFGVLTAIYRLVDKLD